ncbi:MAG TPA: hypothetical protein VFB84_21775 [Micromonosporaceae bacterium]|nr:hypothetical protein [Micromonosporaceae bacterium]
MLEDIDGEAGVEVELVEEEVVRVDGEDVVRLERRLGEVSDVEGDDDLGVGAYCGSERLGLAVMS